MKNGFSNILNRKKKRNGFGLISLVLLLIGAVSLLTACTSVSGNAVFKPGTIYSYDSSGQRVVVHDAGNSYSVDKEGHVTIKYRNGTVTAQTPLKLDGTVSGMGENETGFYISEEKTAMVYGFANGKSPLHIWISDDMGTSWNNYSVGGAMGYDTKFIGFTNKQDGWIVSGGSAGVARSMNYVYQTADGGKTWQELGNANDLYAEQLTGSGFSNKDIGFLGFRYNQDNGPVIYWTKDRGQSWAKLTVALPNKFHDYYKTPLSPIFNGKEGLFPIRLSKQDGSPGRETIYLSSTNYGLTWAYDESYDRLEGS